MLKGAKITAIAMNLKQNNDIISANLLMDIIHFRIALSMVRAQKGSSIPNKNSQRLESLPEIVTQSTLRYRPVGWKRQGGHQHLQTSAPVEYRSLQLPQARLGHDVDGYRGVDGAMICELGVHRRADQLRAQQNIPVGAVRVWLALAHLKGAGSYAEEK